MVIEI